MYVPVISCFFCETFANSTINIRNRLSLHTKGYRILHSRQGSLDRHSSNNCLFELKSANCIQFWFFVLSYSFSDESVDCCGRFSSLQSVCTKPWRLLEQRTLQNALTMKVNEIGVVEAHQYLDLPLWVPFRYRVLTPSLTGLIGTSWKVLVLMFDNAFLYMFAEPKINSLWFNTKIHAQA